MNKIISSFIDSVIEQKKLQFSAKETDFDNLLFDKNILKLEKDKISIANFDSISSCFLEKYKEKLNFKISEKFQINVDFIKGIKEDFTSNKYIPDYHILEKEIWKSIIKESNSVWKCNFNEYLNSLSKDKKSDRITDFTNAYSNLLPSLDLSNTVIFDNVLIQTELTKSDAHYNIDLGTVLNGLKNKCKADYDTGVELLKKALSISEDKENIISVIVTGLYENKKI